MHKETSIISFARPVQENNIEAQSLTLEAQHTVRRNQRKNDSDENASPLLLLLRLLHLLNPAMGRLC